MPIKGVIFDLDGVLVDTEPLSDQHLMEFLISIGVKDPQKLNTNSLRGLNIQAFLKVLITEFNLDYDPEELKNIYRPSYIAFLEALPTLPEIPGAKQLVEHLDNSGYKLAIGSSAGPARIKLLLKKLGLQQYFPTIVSGDDIANSKPAPDAFLLAAERLGLPPTNGLVIEDSTNGILAAKAAGMQCLAYGGSSHNSNDLSAADMVTKDFTTFTATLKQPGASLDAALANNL